MSRLSRPAWLASARHTGLSLSLVLCVTVLLSTAAGQAVSADPEPGAALSWVTFLGGDGESSYDDAADVAVDGDGYIYVTGDTQAAWTATGDPAPVRPYSSGDYTDDAYVAKLEPDGDLVWYTFLGGGGMDHGYAITVDSDYVYVTGRSDNYGWSQDGDGSPVRPHSVGFDAFAARLDLDTGALNWYTFLGGSNTDAGCSIAVDDAGNVFVAGISEATWGTGEGTVTPNPARAYTSGKDVFVAGLDADGRLLWNTFLGGSGNECLYYECGVAADDEGNVFVAGNGPSSLGSNPVRDYSGGEDAFVARLDADDGDLTLHTFLGGPDGYYGDWGHDITAGDGHVYFTGYSDASWGVDPVQEHPGGNAAVAVKLADDLTVTWHTFLGGNTQGNGVCVDSSSNIYIAGGSGSNWGSPDNAFSGGWDVFAAKLSPNGSLVWNTFAGGGGSEGAFAVAFDDASALTVSGYGDSAWAPDPIRDYSGWQDGLVLQFAVPAVTEPEITEGDANLDDETNIIDAMFIAQYTVGLRELDATQLLCADTTDDGQVNIVDAMHVAQFTVDPNGDGGVLYKQLWETPADDDLLNPLTA